jgi:Fic family protein
MVLAAETYWNIPPNQPKALMLAQRALSHLVHDAVLLEGLNFTLPEIQTLLDGITVGGHRLSDQQIALNQAEAWQELFKQIKKGSFSLSSDAACALHAIAGKEEALAWGAFRQGGVAIAGTPYTPPPSDELADRYTQMLDDLQHIEDVYAQSFHLFLTCARTQFFYDVNKRMGRFLMNGHLLHAGYPVINVPAKKQLEFNTLMLDFYASNQQDAMHHFLRNCMDESIVAIMQEAVG